MLATFKPKTEYKMLMNKNMRFTKQLKGEKLLSKLRSLNKERLNMWLLSIGKMEPKEDNQEEEESLVFGERVGSEQNTKSPKNNVGLPILVQHSFNKKVLSKCLNLNLTFFKGNSINVELYCIDKLVNSRFQHLRSPTNLAKRKITKANLSLLVTEVLDERHHLDQNIVNNHLIRVEENLRLLGAIVFLNDAETDQTEKTRLSKRKLKHADATFFINQSELIETVKQKPEAQMYVKCLKATNRRFKPTNKNVFIKILNLCKLRRI